MYHICFIPTSDGHFFHAKTTELNSFNRKYMAHKAKVFTIWPFIEMFCPIWISTCNKLKLLVQYISNWLLDFFWRNQNYIEIYFTPE